MSKGIFKNFSDELVESKAKNRTDAVTFVQPQFSGTKHKLIVAGTQSRKSDYSQAVTVVLEKSELAELKRLVMAASLSASISGLLKWAMTNLKNASETETIILPPTPHVRRTRAPK